MKTDLIIIGAGPGGYETAIAAAKAGLSVALIEANKVGGTCLNEGCIPTKAFCRNAEVVDTLREAETFGISPLNFDVDFTKVVARKNEVVATLGAGVDMLLKHKLIMRIQGRAEFKDAHTIIVPNATTIAGESIEDEEFTATDIIIATGSVTKFLPIEGAHLPGVLTSAEMLNVGRVPASLCIIGGGVIGLEFASIFSRFGSHVIVVEFCKEILPNFDADIAKRLRQSLKTRGIEFATSAAVTAIHQTENSSFTVSYEQKGATQTVEAETVLMAVGRAANTQSLGLEAAGITFDNRGISVDENMQTNRAHVYAIGDVNGRCMLAHAATFQGRRALNHILGRTDNIRLDIVPAAVFTVPEAAMVGKTEEQCKAEGIQPIIKKAFFRANGKALAMHETDGMVKLIASEETGELLGCHLFGAHAADIVQEVAALMNRRATLTDFRDIIHGHPTLGEVLQTAATE